MSLTWRWSHADETHQTYGNSNQWTVSAGMPALARESAQNSNDARVGEKAALVYEFIRLTGEARAEFEAALKLGSELRPHLEAMGEVAEASVAARQIRSGLEELDKSDAITLLKVTDYGCRGLTGPDLPGSNATQNEWGNLIKLCRLDLFSGKDEASGGSFGLGKAVYWRFSRIQTALFNSSLHSTDALDGHTQNRVLGVSQGVPHQVDGRLHVGRGFFGSEEAAGHPVAAWSPPEIGSLQLDRHDVRPGTTAMIVGFYDPDAPETGESADGLRDLATQLQVGIEENFWPLITRGRLDVTIRIRENEHVLYEHAVDPRTTYTELVDALERYDSDSLDEELGDVYSTVVRDIPIRIPERVDAHAHPEFVHTAKLVVTVSDTQPDTLENRVCLFRKPEMVVETIDRAFDGKTYHAFLLAGIAVAPDLEDPDHKRADDFLRLAEPPAHDQWIPRSGRTKASQANLTTDTFKAWGSSLRGIGDEIERALRDLFDIAPEPDERGPQSIIKHLSFLAGEGKGNAGSSNSLRKPTISLSDWQVQDGRWVVTFEITARNQEGGWRVRPELKLLGLDGRGQTAAWESIESLTPEAQIENGSYVLVPSKQRGRKLSAVLMAVSTPDLGIPAEESVVDVVIGEASMIPSQPNSEKAGEEE